MAGPSPTQRQAKKLASCIRLLLSNNLGERSAALKGVERTLTGVANNAADIHALADYIEHPSGSGLDQKEMKEIYDAGYSDGKRDSENQRFAARDFHNIDGTPDLHEIAKFCQQNSQRLNPNEARFINDVTARTVWRRASERQEKWLLSIFYRLGGRI